MPTTDFLYALQSRVRRAALPLERAHALGDLAFTEMRMGYVDAAEAKLAEIALLGTGNQSASCFFARGI